MFHIVRGRQSRHKLAPLHHQRVPWGGALCVAETKRTDSEIARGNVFLHGRHRKVKSAQRVIVVVNCFNFFLSHPLLHRHQSHSWWTAPLLLLPLSLPLLA